MIKSTAIAAILAVSTLTAPSALAADYDGEYPRRVEVDVDRGRDHDHGDRWRHRGPRVGIVIGDSGRRYGYCRNWRHECADRWGWGGWRFQRCLDRHGC